MKTFILLITSLIFLSSCSMDGKDTKTIVPEKQAQEQNKVPPEKGLIAPDSLNPMLLASLEAYAGKSLGKDGWVLLKNVALFLSYTEENKTYNLYSGTIEPKYCKPMQADCIAKKFIIITEDTIPKYYDESLDEKFACTGLDSAVPQKISEQIRKSSCLTETTLPPDPDCKATGCSAGESCNSIMYECKNGSGELSKCESYQCVKG